MYYIAMGWFFGACLLAPVVGHFMDGRPRVKLRKPINVKVRRVDVGEEP